jgi:hypothetical protein
VTAGSSAGFLTGCTGGVLAANRRQNEEHFLAVTDLGRTFFKVDFGQKTSRNRRLPPPPF